MRTAVLLVALGMLAVAIAYLIFSKPHYPLSEEDARKYFLEDLKEKYPNADVREIMEILALSSSDGTPYYQLKARVTFGMSTPCPERLHVYYEYPPKNFVAQPPEYITKGCKICINEPTCIIAFPEEATIASHTYPGTEAVAQFVKSNSDAAASVSFDATSGNWLVRWQSASAGFGYNVRISKSENRVLSVEKS
ncbi:MAG: hypothetical protein N3E51_01775 [Candidatus Micrarchaeota archaeon]|nr:hypothetical protein [Candidatus Micrarchaeota archaeon]